MNFKIKDEAQLRRYRNLSPDDRAKFDQIMRVFVAHGHGAYPLQVQR